MTCVAGPSESSRLLVNTASEDSSSPLQQKSVCISCPPSKRLCLPSKEANIILLWTIIVGAMYFSLVGFSAALILNNSISNITLSQYEPLQYVLLAIVMMFYPLSGFIADVCCGQLKTVVISLLAIPFILLDYFIAVILFVS